MTKKIFSAFVFALCMAGTTMPPALAQEKGESPRFFYRLEDVPLMPGLTELEKESYVFDKAEGRIIYVKAAAAPTISLSAIRVYYNDVLPQFGWQKTGDGVFVRGREHMMLDVSAEGDSVIAEFTVTPK